MTTNMRFGRISAVKKPKFTFGNSISKFSELKIRSKREGKAFLLLRLNFKKISKCVNSLVAEQLSFKHKSFMMKMYPN